MRKSRLTIAALAMTVPLALAACSSSSTTGGATSAPATTSAAASPTPSETMTETAAAGTIVDVAASNDDFSTLVAAVEAAGLAETLSGDGPFTVFAPTNEAFAALPPGLLDALLLPENKEVLTKILTYHVVAGKVMAADVTPGKVDTVEGSKITIAVDGGTVTVDESLVTATDVEASNGVIHVIDAVLVPKDVDVSTLL